MSFSSDRHTPKRKKYSYEKNRTSLEFFHPAPHSEERTASAKSAVFNLVSTIIGGGILSLPYTFDKCGVLLAILFMVVAAFASCFSLYIIVSCSRRSGAKSYEEITRIAFGRKAQVATMLLLIMLTFLAFVAYVVLLKDLVGSLVEQYILQRHMSLKEKNSSAVICVLLISPILALRSINALRFTSIFSLLTVLVLAVAISIRAFGVIDAPNFEKTKSIKILPSNWTDVLYSFPIISCAFLCHFNVIPMYRELQKPTRVRLKKIVWMTMAMTCLFYIVVGGMGYLYAFQSVGGVKDDILNHFSSHDELINLGRVGLAVTVLLSLPLLLLPCRATLYRLIIFCGQQHDNFITSDETTNLVVSSQDEEEDSDDSPTPSLVINILLTVVIIASACFLAVIVPGVAVVWSIMGSSAGILVSYVIPSISYIKIRQSKSNTDCRKFGCWVLFSISSIMCVLCTVQAFYKVVVLIF